MRAADDGESDCASLFGFGDLLRGARCGLALSSRPSEFLGVGQDQVHVLG